MKKLYNYLKFKDIKSIYNNQTIFCLKRKKYFIFSYEELLRQKIILFLILEKGYNIYNISVEEYFLINNKKYRIDILVKKNKLPYMIIECKSPKIKIINNNFNQILEYGNIINNKYYLLTNETNSILFKILKKKIIFIKKIPLYN
ncbi:MAG: type I restriction enzyme HsdR N-terminal domain-containing protein [Candidatus Shikimatogenerans sp. JK-2022]|nr:type I restriction enzyme HsdR N-terminal domain-containing protein [Candidatus Shikimatogenerans bostrichidophilus]